MAFFSRLMHLGTNFGLEIQGQTSGTGGKSGGNVAVSRAALSRWLRYLWRENSGVQVANSPVGTGWKPREFCTPSFWILSIADDIAEIV